MKNKLVREIEGHKFYSKAYSTKDEAGQNCKDGFASVLENGTWFNFVSSLGFQEDIHERP